MPFTSGDARIEFPTRGIERTLPEFLLSLPPSLIDAFGKQ